MSSILTLQQRKNALLHLGEYLLSADEELNDIIQSSRHYNAWFTPDEVSKAVKAFGALLTKTNLDLWLNFESQTVPGKKIGLVLAGNIPLVGFHDILAVLCTGHTALIKLSSQDPKLIPHILNKLVAYEPLFGEKIIYRDKLEGYDAVIATGSNNTSRYFEYYFGSVPHIIRKNRNSVAVLSGDETSEELKLLGHDIFDYFGMGCRNVSKVFVPEEYDFKKFFESIESFGQVINHHKYNNNYDYNKSIYLVNREAHLDNGFILVKEETRLASPLAVLYYEPYKSLKTVESKLNEISQNIQCLVSSINLNTPIQQVYFGQSQQPKLWDYADGINTIEFLLSLYHP
ncbi:acyl-CoA reductase [Desertivirga xinjiangensis]|uniref:acyl-CoA reductase n=1 Tax=Desertivirga xinjiangensis TaxID=539206 RepID=UPI00210EE092|nr:acyl-CoA reductase [Pedobacter xinjiangensis]